MSMQLSDLASRDLLGARVLVVDDEPANVRVLERLLQRAGYDRIRTTTDSREVEELFEDFDPDRFDSTAA